MPILAARGRRAATAIMGLRTVDDPRALHRRHRLRESARATKKNCRCDERRCPLLHQIASCDWYFCGETRWQIRPSWGHAGAQHAQIERCRSACGFRNGVRWEFVVWRTSRRLCVRENFGSVHVRTASLSLFAVENGIAFAAQIDCERTVAGRSFTGSGSQPASSEFGSRWRERWPSRPRERPRCGWQPTFSGVRGLT